MEIQANKLQETRANNETIKNKNNAKKVEEKRIQKEIIDTVKLSQEAIKKSNDIEKNKDTYSITTEKK